MIDYRKIGNGNKVMVMLPGLALKSTLGLADQIAVAYSIFKDYTIYLFDDRDQVIEGYSLRDRANDVAIAMKEIGLKDAYVFGASMGGMVGQYLAIDHPELVKKLQITSSCSRMNDKSETVITTWRDLAISNKIDNLIDSLADEIYSKSVVEKYGEAIKAGMMGVSKKELSKFIILCNAILNVNTYDELEKIKCSIRVTASLGDQVLTFEASEEISKKLNCELYIYSNEYGHGVYDEALDHGKLMLEFFEQN